MEKPTVGDLDESTPPMEVGSTDLDGDAGGGVAPDTVPEPEEEANVEEGRGPPGYYLPPDSAGNHPSPSSGPPPEGYYGYHPSGHQDPLSRDAYYHYPSYHHQLPPHPSYHYPSYHQHRRSPPSASRSSARAFPATPASNSEVSRDVHRQKISPKSAQSTPSSTPGTKTQRGLRHFSIMVCKHVEEQKITTYNQVADELVRQVRESSVRKGKFDEKNIRRRVYDALNVLLAMGIISKDKKDILWRGLPNGPYIVGDEPTSTPSSPPTNNEERAEDAGTTTPPAAAADADASDKPAAKPIYTDESEYSKDEFQAMEEERNYLQAEVKRKQDSLQELLTQQVCFHNLVVRNQNLEHPRDGGPPSIPPEDEKIPLPFIICNTKPSAVVQCDMNKDKTDVMFEFDSPFEINDDNTILKRMKMDRTTALVLYDMVPEDMYDYCHDAGLFNSVLLPGEDPACVQRRVYALPPPPTNYHPQYEHAHYQY